MGLSSAQFDALQGLVRVAPDGVLVRLEGMLAAAAKADSALLDVHRLAETEAADRRLRERVLDPLHPLAFPMSRPSGFENRPLFAARDYRAIWPLMKSCAVEPYGEVVALASDREEEPALVAFDDLCVAAASALRADPALGRGFSDPKIVADLLGMVPMLRRARSQIPFWLRNLTDTRVSALRLAFKDATEAAPDAGSLFTEALQAYLDEPNRILRLISGLMDRPTDRYLASSELSGFGERLLDEVDRWILSVRTFDPDRGREGGAAAAAAVAAASDTLLEFDQWVELSPEGPWGKRVIGQKRELALAVEKRFAEIKKAVAAAMPTDPHRLAGSTRPSPAPRVADAPDAEAVRRAEGLLAFLDETRHSADQAGFASMRAQVVEALDLRLDHYVEILIETLHAGEVERGPDLDHVRAYIAVAADAYGMVKGPKPAQVVRRRAAAATSVSPLALCTDDR